MDLLLAAHADVGGEIVSSGGTGTFDLHDRVTEVQAGSYALMDTQYATLIYDDKGQPFTLALSVVGTVISVSPQWAVLDVGLKALGMDHGNPSVDGAHRVVLLGRAPHVRARRRCASAARRPGPGLAGPHRPDDGVARAGPRRRG